MEPTQSENSIDSIATQPAVPTTSVYPNVVTPVVPADRPTETETIQTTATSTTELTETNNSAVLSGPIVGGADQPPIMMSGNPSVGRNPSHKRQILTGAIVVALLIILGGGYVFGYYLPNKPDSIYSTGIVRTGDALDSLVTYSKSQTQKPYKSYDISGTLQDTGSASYGATLTGSMDMQGNATFKVAADIEGEKVNANIDSVHASGSTTPDMYIQMSGIKSTLDGLGMSSLDSLDGEWIAIDHTVIDSFLSNVNKDTSVATSASAVPTAAEVTDAETRVQAVNKLYVFTTNSSNAVLTDEKYVGLETKNGRKAYHYVVGYNKPNLKRYVSAIGVALDSSTLNTWSKVANNGKSVSEALDIASLQKSVASANVNYTFDVWIDAGTKIASAIQLTNPNDKGAIFTLSQNYTGGTSYPLSLEYRSKDASNGDMQDAGLLLTVDTASNKISGNLISAEGSANTILNFALTPSNTSVNVTAPMGAKPIAGILNQLNLGGVNSVVAGL
jgi:hypothetical protein